MTNYDAWKANVPSDPKELSIKLSCDCGQWKGTLEDITKHSVNMPGYCPICCTEVWPGLDQYIADQEDLASELKHEMQI